MAVTYKKLIDVGSIVENKIIAQAGLMLGVIGANAAKALCPVRTGDLRGSINHRPEKNYVAVYTDKEYAPYVEFGTAKQAAQPFLEQSMYYVEQNIGVVAELCRREIK